MFILLLWTFLIEAGYCIEMRGEMLEKENVLMFNGHNLNIPFITCHDPFDLDIKL